MGIGRAAGAAEAEAEAEGIRTIYMQRLVGPIPRHEGVRRSKKGEDEK